MPVLAEFSPQGTPGQSGRALMAGRDAAENWMDRAQGREASQQAVAMSKQQMALNALLMPVKAAQAQAETEKAKVEYAGAIQTQGARTAAYGMLDKARMDFDFINTIEDDKARASASRQWLSKYSQLQNVAELAEEMKVKNHLATSNVMDAIKIATLGSAQARAFEALTEGFSPEEKMRAQRVKSGLDGRASGAAISYKIVDGPNGEKQLVAVDPRAVGAQVIGTGQTFGSGVGATDEAAAFTASGQPKTNVFQGQTTAAEAQAKEAGKIKAEKAAAAPKAKLVIDKVERNGERLIDDIDNVLTQVNTLTAGPGGVVMGTFPGSSARDLQANLDSIVANIGFEALQSMREASKTGGALGAISERENELLQATLASLKVGQSPAQLISNLKKARSRIAENVGAARRGFEAEYGGEGAASVPKSIADMSTEELEERQRKLRGDK